MILFCIVLVFYITHIPRLIFRFLYYLDHNDERSWYLIYPIFRLALTMNSSVNFIIYSMAGREFRAEFVKLFNCKKAPTSKISPSGSAEQKYRHWK